MKKIITERFHLHITLALFFGLLAVCFLFWAMDFTDFPLFFRLLVLFMIGAFVGMLWEKFGRGRNKDNPTSWADVRATGLGFVLAYPAYFVPCDFWMKTTITLAVFNAAYFLTELLKERIKR